MSKLLKPTNYTENGIIGQNINAIVNIHDLSCSCNNPLKCIIKQIYLKEKGLKFKPEELKQWLTGGETTATTGEEEDPITAEDVDALFAAIDTEDTG